MTISSTNNVVVFTGNGVTTVFPFDFTVFESAHLEVRLYTIATSTYIVLPDTDYSVTGIGPESTGGTVTYNPSGVPTPTTQSLAIYRILPYTQDLNIRNQSGFYPDIIERQLDEMVMQIQQIAEAGSRALVVPPTEDIDTTELIEKILAVPAQSAAAVAAAAAAAASAATLTYASLGQQRIGTEANRVMSPAGVAEHINYNIGITRLQISNRYISALTFVVSGESTVGDYGAGALYIRGTSGGLRAIQDAAGTWWNLSVEGKNRIESGWFGNTQAAIQQAINTCFANGGGEVWVFPRTYTLTSILYMQANVYLCGQPLVSILQQGVGVNLSVLVDFSVNVAHNSGLRGITVHGNRANNTLTVTDKYAVYVHTANDVVIEDCEIKQWTGHAVYTSTGLRTVVKNNLFNSISMYGVYINFPTLGTRNRPVIVGNRFEFVGWHTVVVIRSIEAIIQDNFVINYNVVGQTINVTGAIATLTAGPNWADLVPGNFLIYSAGAVEALVVSKQSNTQVTLNFSPGDVVGVPCASGSADSICSWSSTFTRIKGNKVVGGASLGFSIFSDVTNFASSDTFALVEENIVESIGSAGFSVQSSGAGNTNGIVFKDNLAVQCGLNTTASDPIYNSGYTLSGTLSNVSFSGNKALSLGSAMHSVYINDGPGKIRGSHNRLQTNTPFFQNAASVVLSGWGAGAAASLLEVTEDSIYFRITTTAAAPSLNASITVTHGILPERMKRAVFTNIATSATRLEFLTFIPEIQNDSAGVVDGTPAVSATYDIVVKL